MGGGVELAYTDKAISFSLLQTQISTKIGWLENSKGQEGRA